MAADVEIVRLDPAHNAEAGEVLARAFASDPLMAYILPDAARRPAVLPAMMGATVAFSQKYGESWATAGAVRGVANWVQPGIEMSPEQWEAVGIGDAMALMGEEAAGRMTALLELMGTLHARAALGPHWYLLTLGVEPALQGQGIGGRLIQPILERATAEGLACYLETATEIDIKFYTRHGFVVLEEARLPGSDVPFWTMVRPARPG